MGAQTNKTSDSSRVWIDNPEEIPGGAANPTHSVVDSSVLPTGAATAAKQDTQITAEQALLATAGAVTDPAVTTDADGTLSAKLRGLIVQVITILSNLGTIIGHLASLVAGIFPHIEKTEVAYVTGATADTGAPSSAGDGIAFQSDTVDLIVAAIFNLTDGASVADIIIWILDKNGVWFVPSAGQLEDLQLETNDAWRTRVPNAGKFGTRFFIEIDNFAAGAAGGNIDIKTTETTM